MKAKEHLMRLGFPQIFQPVPVRGRGEFMEVEAPIPLRQFVVILGAI